MALLRRIKETKSINLFNNFRRFYSLIHAPQLLINQTSAKPVSHYYHYIQFTNPPKNLGFFDSRVRFFAAPAQFLKKAEVKEVHRTRINEEIQAEVVRLVTDEGHTVVSRWEALKRAKELTLDLVEVNRNAKPPVCKIMNYTREKYKQQVKGKELAKSKAAVTLKSVNKEVRFPAKAEFKDVKTKVDGVKRLMDRGYRVKCTAVASADGRDLNVVLSEITALMEDVGIVESGPQIDEKQGFIIVRHVKFGLPKKGKKPSTVSSKVLSPAKSDIKSPSDSPVESGDSEDDVDLDNEVKDHLQYQETSPSRSNNVMGSSKSQSSNFPPNVTPAPQPQNRYAKIVPNNAPPMRTPHSQEFPPVIPRQAGSEGSSSRNSGIPPSRSIDVMGTSKSQSPNFPPNVTPAPQLQNRYAKKLPNNAPPVRTPHSQGVPPVFPRQAGRGGSSSRNSWPLQNANSQHRGEIPNEARQNGNNFSPLIGNPRPPSSPRGDVPKSTSFGVFSEVKPNNGRFESGVDQKVTREFTGRGNTNPPKFNSDGGVAGDNKKFGIFSVKK